MKACLTWARAENGHTPQNNPEHDLVRNNKTKSIFNTEYLEAANYPWAQTNLSPVFLICHYLATSVRWRGS